MKAIAANSVNFIKFYSVVTGLVQPPCLTSPVAG